MAPRSLWNGTLTFGLVNVPVKVYTATESKSIRFHQVHLDDGARIEHRRVCPKEDKEVPYDEIGREYEDVILTDEELSAADPRKTRTIDIESFVEQSEIDQVNGQQAVERVVHLGHQPLDPAHVGDAGLRVGDPRGPARRGQRVELRAIQQRRGVGRGAQPRHAHRLGLGGQDRHRRAVADR